MRTISMACCCLLAECLDRLWVFLLCLLPMGVLMGLTTWGYLQEAALVICVAFQIPLSLAYLAHRRLVTRHPELWSVTLAFPSVHTALWTLSSLVLPVGSFSSPAYDVAGQWLMLTQCSAWLGRSAVTFVLSWVAASGAHRWASSHGPGFKAALASLFIVCIAGGIRFYVPTISIDRDFVSPGGAVRDFLHVSCLSSMDNLYATTAARLAAGDAIVMHSERLTDAETGLDAPVPRYQHLLEQHFNKTQIEAVIVLSFEDDGKSWYHLVTREGSVMSYAKNHPVPFVESDLSPGTSRPTVTAPRALGRPDAEQISLTGTICFDTDFPAVTRFLDADLLLETSQTWSNIGRQHLRGHQYAALENGQTLVKCTKNGYTGAIDPYGSIIEQVPQGSGVVSMMVPRFPKLVTFPLLYLIFDSIVGLAACLWLLLACSPQLSCRWLGRCHF